MGMNSSSCLIIFPLVLIILFSPSTVSYGVSFTPQSILKTLHLMVHLIQIGQRNGGSGMFLYPKQSIHKLIQK